MLKSFFVPMDKQRKESKELSEHNHQQPKDEGDDRLLPSAAGTSSGGTSGSKRKVSSEAFDEDLDSTVKRRKGEDEEETKIADAILSSAANHVDAQSLRSSLRQWAKNHPPRRLLPRWQAMTSSNQLADPFKLKQDCSPITSAATPPVQCRKSGENNVKVVNLTGGDNAFIQHEREKQHENFQRPFRRKLLQIPFDEEQRAYARPPFWGSWPNTRPHKRTERVSGKRPFFQEPALDYEEESADEWEEEEPGELVDKDDDENEEGVEKEEDNDDEGFMVPDGYLSDDERRNRVDDEEAAAEQQQQPASAEKATVATSDATTDKRLVELEKLIATARTSKTPLLISRLPTHETEGASSKHVELLQCLSVTSFDSAAPTEQQMSGIAPTVPMAIGNAKPQQQQWIEQQQAVQQLPKQKRLSLSAAMSEKLREFVQHAGREKKESIVRGFVSEHQSSTSEKLSLAAVRTELSAIATYANGMWQVMDSGNRRKRSELESEARGATEERAEEQEPTRKRIAPSNKKMSDFGEGTQRCNHVEVKERAEREERGEERKEERRAHDHPQQQQKSQEQPELIDVVAKAV
jgi:hypothetical protein